MGIGLQELLLVLVLVLIFFGAEKIPQLAKSLGKGIGEFRHAQREVRDELLKETDPAEPFVATPPDLPTVPAYAVCPACQGRTIAASLFCSQCGRRMPAPAVCGVCQRTLEQDEKYCPNCGQARE